MKVNLKTHLSDLIIVFIDIVFRIIIMSFSVYMKTFFLMQIIVIPIILSFL